MAVTLPAVVEELLSEMAAAVRDGARISDEHLSSLKFVFGSSAIQALDLVDRESVTLISSPSGRRVYQVVGSSGKTYTCLASCHYCSCPAFAFSVLRKSDSLLELLHLHLRIFVSPQSPDVGKDSMSAYRLFQRDRDAPPSSAEKAVGPWSGQSRGGQCKHLLAIYLSQVMRNCQQLSVSDKQLTDLLLMEKTQEA